jgi:SprT protein
VNNCTNNKGRRSQDPDSQPRLTSEDRDEIIKLVHTFYEIAAHQFGCSAQSVAVSFRLRGRAAGQWRLRQGQESLHFNERLFAADPAQHIPDTVAHEVAHSVVYRCHGRGRRPHGPEWRAVMRHLGFEPRVTHETSPEMLAQALDHHLYRCACRSHALGPRQHQQVRRGKRDYRCRLCGTRLVRADHAPENTEKEM